jgi:hypothetical protein
MLIGYSVRQSSNPQYPVDVAVGVDPLFCALSALNPSEQFDWHWVANNIPVF